MILKFLSFCSGRLIDRDVRSDRIVTNSATRRSLRAPARRERDLTASMTLTVSPSLSTTQCSSTPTAKIRLLTRHRAALRPISTPGSLIGLCNHSPHVDLREVRLDLRRLYGLLRRRDEFELCQGVPPGAGAGAPWRGRMKLPRSPSTPSGLCWAGAQPGIQSLSCHGWQWLVLNAVSVGSICTT